MTDITILDILALELVSAEIDSWLTIILALIAIISFFLMIIFYFKSKKEKIPYYDIINLNLVQDLVSKVDSLEMSYSGELIETLTVTRVAFWNGGRETINNQDIVGSDPPRVRAKEGCRILGAQILYATPANQFRLEMAEDQSNVILNFNYIDKDEGMIAQLFHTGKSSEDTEVCGRIKGAGTITRVYTENPSLSLRVPRYVTYLIILLFGYSAFMRFWETLRLASFISLFVSLLLIAYLVVETEVLRKRVPRDFVEYFDRLKFYWIFKDRKYR
jgi:hypothetical protein